MSSDKYSRSVSMLCSTCGGDKFEFDSEDENAPVLCASCGRTYRNREELMQENQARIEENVDEVKSQIVSDLHDSLRKAFKGSKNITFK